MSNASSQTSQPAQSSCCEGKGRTVLLYACSGGANVGEMADRAARELMYQKRGTMFCLAGLGGGIQGMIQTAKDADLNLVIDGCDMDCSRNVFEKAGVTNYRHFRVTDLGIQKAKPKAATEEEITRVVSKAKEVLVGTGCCPA